MLLIFLSGFSISVFGQAANIDQIRNGAAASPLNPADWVNGNAGPSNAHYAEGYSIPYRMHVTGLSSGSHVLVIEWDTKDQNGHAIDYITHYNNMDNPAGSHMATFNHAAEGINPTLGISGLGASSTFPIPAPSSVGSEVAGQPAASFNALAPGLRLMTIYGGTITAMNYTMQEAADATTASTTTQLSITFTTTNSQVLLAWGGHIAAEYDWGAGRGATGVNGSPYHTRLISIDGSGGNQDRSLKASAVVIPPPLCGISPAQFACPETNSLSFSAQGSSSGLGISYVWSLTNGTPSAGAKIDGSTTGFNVSVVPVGADFIAGGTFSLSLTVNRTGARSTTCTRSPAGTIVRTVVDATASPMTINLATGNTSTLNAVLTGSDDTNPANYNFVWSQSPAAGGTLSATNVQSPVFTATAAGSYTFTVTATQKAAPGCSATDNVVVNVTGAPPPCNVVGPSPICPSTTNSYIYDVTGDNVADPIPANFTAVWTLENNTNNATPGAITNTNTFSVTASSQCNTGYRVRITLTSTSGLITATCFKDVLVQDNQPPTITNCPADVTIECDASSLPANTGLATATDNCSATVTYTDAVVNGCYTVITRTWKATDPCGNSTTCTQRIIKRDRTAPVITCPASGDATATDNCTPTNQIVIHSRTNGSVRTWTAIDLAGNISTCNQSLAGRMATTENVREEQTQQAPVQASPGEANVSKSISTKISAPTDKLMIEAFPNPFRDEINFRFTSPIKGKALLEVYDFIGRRVGVVYQGSIDANIQQQVRFPVPDAKKTALIYKLSIGTLSSRGSLLPAKH